MKYCTNCGEPVGQGDAFCSSCGTAIGSPSNRKNSQNTKQRKKADFKAQQAVSMSSYNQIREDSAVKFKQLNNVARIICISAFPVYFIVGDIAIIPLIAGVLIGFSNAMRNGANRFLSSDEYYSIPYSRYADGSHRCIFCGGKGIYKSTPYKTNITECVCSKCNAGLYSY